MGDHILPRHPHRSNPPPLTPSSTLPTACHEWVLYFNTLMMYPSCHACSAHTLPFGWSAPGQSSSGGWPVLTLEAAWPRLAESLIQRVGRRPGGGLKPVGAWGSRCAHGCSPPSRVTASGVERSTAQWVSDEPVAAVPPPPSLPLPPCRGGGLGRWEPPLATHTVETV